MGLEVVINGAAKEIGRAEVIAVTKARGMEVAGAVDSYFVGEDTRKVCDMKEPLEIPIMNDLTMVLGSISHVTFQFQYLSKLTLTEHSPLMPYHFDINEFYQSKETGVVIDFTQPSAFYDNVKQTTAFGLKSVVYVPRIKADTISALSAFCEKASMVRAGVIPVIE
ncbi:dihydrodipicolinate reductase-like protein CRR1, chloroplastic [Hibiscus syriacus]|uniref:dihydrodipicolinate reductase-like protein CRR1, chloroplastic n=1 Tax=Hibiscus syriacus TaxID=106335 RepID=UPI0019248EEE|nr:dihydrodipicolinate reductase-like protein CRR1, chloroplastic [Hibiscus syriacus]